MPKGRSITRYEREKIETWLRMEKEKTWIAKRLNRDYSIIKREIKRNTGEQLPYDAAVAQTLSEKRARKTNVRKLNKLENKKLKEFVEEKLKADLSPEQIAGILKEYPQADIAETISYDYIYHHAEKQKELYRHLRTGGVKDKESSAVKSMQKPLKTRFPSICDQWKLPRKKSMAIGRMI